ncbi:MaoC family dehydratase [Actinoplanes sp. TFC3]|uniref:MaoC family dehydratase n=1 Tax=Actinoplanes sp. TFC3 TaxID=1710355 RepID=UPI00082AA2DE|nr:MaoC family dehydratase [Actinoplanes sp. TFC3]
MKVFAEPGSLLQAAGQHLGVSGWRTISQRDIDTFAELTGDDQWIHVDVDRAAAGPWGTTIAHGYLLAGLLTPLLAELFAVHGTGLAVNGGLEQLRFVTPVPAGSRIRAGAAIAEAVAVPGGFVSLSLAVTVEREGQRRPALTARTHSLYRAAG